MNFIGIDPGVDGAVGSIRESGIGNVEASVIPTPVIWVKKGRKSKKTGKELTKREYLGRDMKRVLDDLIKLDNDVIICFEKSQAFPKQGGVSNHSTGRGSGLWEGILIGMGIPYETVNPRAWKKTFGLNKDKSKSIILAMQLFPMIEIGKKEDGLAEALLLAEYMRRKFGSK